MMFLLQLREKKYKIEISDQNLNSFLRRNHCTLPEDEENIVEDLFRTPIKRSLPYDRYYQAQSLQRQQEPPIGRGDIPLISPDWDERKLK